MKIYVKSKRNIKKLGYKDPMFFKDVNRYFISIAGPADGCEYPHYFLTKDSKRVLHLLFDDVTESEKGNPAFILFDEEIANKIFEFIKTIPNGSEIYVNCAAGISRSGAVGYILNEYFNKYLETNEVDNELFLENNNQIQPNPMVKRILQNVFFGNIDYSKIF